MTIPLKRTAVRLRREAHEAAYRAIFFTAAAVLVLAGGVVHAGVTASVGWGHLVVIVVTTVFVVAAVLADSQRKVWTELAEWYEHAAMPRRDA